MNETGVIVGRLSPEELRDLVLNYKGQDDELRVELMRWYDCANDVRDSTSDPIDANLGLVLSKPIIVCGEQS